MTTPRAYHRGIMPSAAAMSPQRCTATTLLLLTVVAGCGTVAGNSRYEAVLDGWVSRPAADLVREWGVPARARSLPDGETAFVYDHRAWQSAVPATYTVNQGYALQSRGEDPSAAGMPPQTN